MRFSYNLTQYIVMKWNFFTDGTKKKPSRLASRLTMSYQPQCVWLDSCRSNKVISICFQIMRYYCYNFYTRQIIETYVSWLTAAKPILADFSFVPSVRQFHFVLESSKFVELCCWMFYIAAYKVNSVSSPTEAFLRHCFIGYKNMYFTISQISYIKKLYLE